MPKSPPPLNKKDDVVVDNDVVHEDGMAREVVADEGGVVNKNDNVVRQHSCWYWIIVIPLCAGLGVLIWYFAGPRLPSCYVDQFSVFALDETTNSSLHNYSIHYDFRLKENNYRRSRDNLGVYYDALNFTFYYKPNINSFFPVEIGDATFAPFYQRKSRSTNRVGSVEARGVRLENGVVSPVLFRVELATAIRFRHPLWKSKRHHMKVGADLRVNDQGNLVNRRVRLKSKAGRNSNVRFEFVGILGLLIFILSS